MNAPCILRQIRVHVEGTRRVLLCTPGQLSHPVAAIGPEHGFLLGTITDFGWMIVNYPGRDPLGLPLSGKGRTWETQWENLDVKIEICTNSGWTEVHDWALVKKAIANN